VEGNARDLTASAERVTPATRGSEMTDFLSPVRGRARSEHATESRLDRYGLCGGLIALSPSGRHPPPASAGNLRAPKTASRRSLCPCAELRPVPGRRRGGPLGLLGAARHTIPTCRGGRTPVYFLRLAKAAVTYRSRLPRGAEVMARSRQLPKSEASAPAMTGANTANDP
jgi:hypothetical protein